MGQERQDAVLQEQTGVFSICSTTVAIVLPFVSILVRGPFAENTRIESAVTPFHLDRYAVLTVLNRSIGPLLQGLVSDKKPLSTAMSQSRQQWMQLFVHRIEDINYNIIIHIKHHILVLVPKLQTC